MQNESQSSSRESSEAKKSQKLSVMFVEDDKGVATLLQAFSSRNPNLATRFYETGEEAVEELRKEKKGGQPFDVVVTDRGLAGEMDGFGVAETIRDEQLAPHVVLLTGSAVDIAGRYTPEQLREKGIHELVGKPFNGMQLMQNLEQRRVQKFTLPEQP